MTVEERLAAFPIAKRLAIVEALQSAIIAPPSGRTSDEYHALLCELGYPESADAARAIHVRRSLGATA